MSDRRNAVFLEEMGVGPQWRLRSRQASAETAAPETFAAAADFEPAPGAAAAPAPAMSSPAPAPAPAPMMPAPVPAAAPVAQRQAPAAPAYATVPAAQPQSPAAAAAAAARAASAAPRDARQTAPATPPEAPASPAAPGTPAAPARAPGTPSIASTGEDMSWFDDAPTPEYKPQRKKVAAPERPPAATAQSTPPGRPAMPPRAASASPAAMSGSAPAFDDLPMDEPPSWFDDDQPATSGTAPAATRGAERMASAAAPAPGRVAGEDIARMDWPSLQAAVASCTRCARCETRQQAIPGRGDEKATWIALDTAPGPAEDAEGYQFAGDPGYLLDNMLKAVGQGTEQGAYLTSLVKCRAPHAPSAEELQACRPYLQRELELTQAKVIVAFGHTAGKGLLGGAARGRIMLHGEIPVVATFHPADLLKKPEDKAKAWQDLCLAKAAHAGRR